MAFIDSFGSENQTERNVNSIPKAIAENPFRILGVFSNSSLKEITANKTKLARYASVGKDVTLDGDMNLMLPSMNRTVDMVEKAYSDLTLPLDKIRYALTWFVKENSIDEMALDYLSSGNKDKALELLEKRENWSALMNMGVLFLTQGNFAAAIDVIIKVIYDDEYRKALIMSVCGETFNIDCSELSVLFIDILKTEISEEYLFSVLIQNGFVEGACHLRDTIVSALRLKINGEITNASRIDESDAEASFLAGIALMQNTKQPLDELKGYLGATDMQYQSVANNVAKQILQLSINYHNSAGPDVDYDKAINLIEYAESIAESKILKDRCSDNKRVIKENKDHLKVRDDEDALFAILESSRNNAASLKGAKTLVDDCKPILQKVKNVLGENDKHYLQVSSSVVNCALGILITVVNDSQKNDGERKQRKIVEEAVKVMESVGFLDMTIDVKARYDTNKSTLKKISAQQTLNKSSFGDFIIIDHPFLLYLFIILGAGLIGGIIGAFSGAFWEGFGVGCGLLTFGFVYDFLNRNIRN